MSRPARGSFEARVLANESRSFHLRLQNEGRRRTLVLHERRECPCGCGGGWEEAEARAELREQVAWARAGLRPVPSRPARGRGRGSARVPTFAEYAAWWLEAKIAGVLGERPISENTAKDYRTRLGHLACLAAPTGWMRSTRRSASS